MTERLFEKYKCWDIVGSTSKNRLQNRGRLQNKFKQKVWNKAENRERDWGETPKIRFFFLSPHTPHFTDFFTDFDKKNPTVLQSRTEEFTLIVAPWVIRARWKEI